MSRHLPKAALRQAGTSAKTPPPLAVFDGASTDIDRFQAIKMQYKALFQKGKPQKITSGYKNPEPMAQSQVEPYQLPQLTSVLKTGKLISRGDTLLDQAEMDLANSATGNDLRTHIQTLHSRILKDKQNDWNNERNALSEKTDDLERKLKNYAENYTPQQKESHKSVQNKQEELEMNELLSERAVLQGQLLEIEGDNLQLKADLEVLNEQLGKLQ